MFVWKIVLCLLGAGQVIGIGLLFLGVVGKLEDSPSGYQPKDFDSNYLHHATTANNEEELELPKQVVLMVVDALRADMMTPKNFPFLLGSLKSHKKTAVLLYNVTVDSPTVTLPRVKTLVTGKSPTYLDILKNLQTSDNSMSSNELLQDNLIRLLRERRNEVNICFFGDETWLRLFPTDADGNSKFFKKWEGVTSFFVKDFYEVDRNVTRNLDSVEDCQFLILHYLGLDHIGHVHGPTQRIDLVNNKLKEMDKVVQKLYSKVLRQTQSDKGKGKSVIIMTGDHGMANAGGHGGSSFEEVTTPLVSVITNTPSIKNMMPTQPLINQIDIAPTLAALFGLEVPQESRGRILLDIVESFQTNDQLERTYQKNCEHLIYLLGNSREAGTYRLWMSEISKFDKPLSTKKFIELENELSSELRGSREEENVSSHYLCGVFLLVVLGCLSAYLVFESISLQWCGAEYAVLLSILPPFMLYFSSSFVEEEHYVRYFLLNLIIMGLFTTTSAVDYSTVWRMFKVLALHRLLVTFNQTGDKWSHLPDVNDWLTEENLAWLAAIIGAAFILRFLRLTNRCSKLTTLAVVFTCAYKILCGTRKTAELWPFLLDQELTFQRISYLMTLLCATVYIYHRCIGHAIFNTIFLLVLNIHRFQNLIVLGLTLTVLLEIIAFFRHLRLMQALHSQNTPKRARTPLATQVAIIWFAHASFFYQGNSNGLATVDVTAGYIGLGSFSSSTVIGLLIFLNTYNYPILIYLHFLTLGMQSICPGAPSNYDQVQSNGSVQKKVTYSMKFSNPLPVICLFSNVVEGIVYSITLIVFRNHLFIWSVFVPKLLYLFTQTVMHFLLMFLYLVMWNC